MFAKNRLLLWMAVAAAFALPSCNQIINYPAPGLSALSPSSVTAGSPTFTLTVTGKNFVPNASIIEWNGTALISIAQSTNVMTATIPASFVLYPGNAQVQVFTPQPGGGLTQTLTFTINPATNPVPQISSISPTQVWAGSNSAAVEILGRNFVASGSNGGASPVASVLLNGNLTTASFINSTELQLTIQAAEIVTAAPLQIAVVNPTDTSGKGGGTSNFVTLNVVNPVPVLSSISPATTQAIAPGSSAAAPALTVTGGNFVTNSYLTVNGQPRTTAFSSGTSLSAQLTAADLAVAGYEQVQVVTPGPGGGSSITLPLVVNPVFNAGLPVLVDLGPGGVQANSGIEFPAPVLPDPAPVPIAGPSSDQHGRFVVFASNSTNVVANQAGAGTEIFVRDTCLGQSSCTPVTNVVSVGESGTPSNGSSYQPTLDSAGAHVAFTSVATNLVATVAVPTGHSQIYWENTCTSTDCTGSSAPAAVLISVSADGAQAGNGDSYDPVVSPDGQYVAFVSLATNLLSTAQGLDGLTPQVYLRNTCGLAANQTSTGCTPTTYLLSSPDGVNAGNGASGHPALSNGATYAAFVSSATNLGATAPNPNSQQEIFLRQTCLVTGSCTAFNTLVSTPDGATPADGASLGPSMTSDGRFIVFASTATNLIPGAGPTQQVYERDTCGSVSSTTTCTPSLRLVSTPDGSTPGNQASEYPSISGSTGQFIAFASSASNLAPGAANGVENVYVRNTCLANTTLPVTCVRATVLATHSAGNPPAAANGSSSFPSISQDGHTVSFASVASNLVSDDVNGAVDAFLASTTF